MLYNLNRRMQMKSVSQIKTGKKENITIITDEIIESIAKTRLFNDNEMDTRLRELHQDLLRESKNKNKCKEVGVIWNLRKLEQVVCVHGIENGVDFRKNEASYELLNSPYKNSIVVLHNHPRNGLFSYRDLASFIKYDSIYAMTIVCNDGTIYTMSKTVDFNGNALLEYYNQNISHKRYGAIKSIAHNAKKFGVIYKCSVRRK
jgi:hypothetical protein